MTIKDTATLVLAKLKIRKLRTTVTILISSILFGFVIAILLLARGIEDNLKSLASSTFKDQVHFLTSAFPSASQYGEAKLQARAQELYSQSTDPNKQDPLIHEVLDEDFTYTYLDPASPFTIQARTEQNAVTITQITDRFNEQAALYNGKVSSQVPTYQINANSTLYIASLHTSPEFEGSVIGGYNNSTGKTLLAPTNTEPLDPLIKVKTKSTDRIQLLFPTKEAATLLSIRKPRTSGSDAKQIKNYINEVNQKAIGHQFTGEITTTDPDTGKAHTTTIPFEIVGILPSPLFLSNESFNPANAIFSWYSNSKLETPIITNPGSALFKSYYSPFTEASSVNIITTIHGIENAKTFREKNRILLNGQATSTQEIISNHTTIEESSHAYNPIIVIVSLVIAVIAVIITVGTVGRIITDENQTIALYRAVGATTKDILQTFAAYIFTLSILIILSSLIISTITALILSTISSPLITAQISAMYNLPNLPNQILLAFEPRILLIFTLILAIGAICLLLVIDRLTNKNIIKDLRKLHQEN